MAGVGDARRANDVDPGVALLAERGSARVQSDPHAYCDVVGPLLVPERALCGDRGLGGSTRIVEDGDEFVSDRVGLFPSCSDVASRRRRRTVAMTAG